VLTLVWPIYVRLSHGFNSYGATFALFFLLAAWLYFWGQLTLLGAVVNRIHTEALEAAGLLGGQLRTSTETCEVRFVDRKDLRRLKIHPSIWLRIQHYLEGRAAPYIG
jgi:uncharacterized BrkB/YihY/UPF0761 family membrane protein